MTSLSKVTFMGIRRDARSSHRAGLSDLTFCITEDFGLGSLLWLFLLLANSQELESLRNSFLSATPLAEAWTMPGLAHRRVWAAHNLQWDIMRMEYIISTIPPTHLHMQSTHILMQHTHTHTFSPVFSIWMNGLTLLLRCSSQNLDNSTFFSPLFPIASNSQRYLC